MPSRSLPGLSPPRCRSPQQAEHGLQTSGALSSSQHAAAQFPMQQLCRSPRVLRPSPAPPPPHHFISPLPQPRAVFFSLD